MSRDHAEDRRRLYLAMLEHPEGITSEDFAHTPALDGGAWIPRVAPRIHELRAEHRIPLGLRRGAFALYRLQRDGEASVSRLRPREAPHTGHHGFTPVAFCARCVSTFPPGHVCAGGHQLQKWQSGTGPTRDACPLTETHKERRAA